MSRAAERDGSAFFAAHFAPLPLMTILRGFDTVRTVELSELAWDIGVHLVEVPIQSAAALDALSSAVDAGAARGMPVGAGTVITVDHVRRAAEAGAAFTVAPGFDREVAEASIDAGLPHLPGVATATEVQRATAFGLGWLKMFPASDLGPGWLRSMHGPFPDARFVATGGMHAGNTRTYLDAGAAGVSLGSALADPARLEAVRALAASLSPRA
ncbi:bifunctional 4-hydroxy-2-oxoglutarate aldolase/2-dehydro-3-deoxy-phosphogluconate aldolase [Actinoallomurus acaciae]|uniref:Bifunctional 4-hydroxy-2-oxoglutarate aldolase/2-dehydro-3-deoxy-phosphogluconate aldolase n=1 Tax=Actinoallomurus acaciae TaxID=502577 RepID=A0ABV5YDT4_9ACTN